MSLGYNGLSSHQVTVSDYCNISLCIGRTEKLRYVTMPTLSSVMTKLASQQLSIFSVCTGSWLATFLYTNRKKLHGIFSLWGIPLHQREARLRIHRVFPNSRTKQHFWKRPPTGMKVDCAYWTSRKMLTTNCEISTAETMTIYRQHSKVTHTKNIWMQSMHLCILTHWGRVTRICISKLNIIGRCQAIIWTNAGILSLKWNFNRNSNIFTEKMHFKMSSAKWQKFCLGLSVLTQ